MPFPCRFRAIFVSIFGSTVFGTFCASVVTDLQQCTLSCIAPGLRGLLSKLPTTRAEFVSISSRFHFDFETRKGAKDSEKIHPLRASRSPRQSTVTRLRYDISQKRPATHRQRSRWSFHRTEIRFAPRPIGFTAVPREGRKPHQRPRPPELCSITFREGFQKRIGSVTFGGGQFRGAGQRRFSGRAAGRRRDGDALWDGDGVVAFFGSESSFRKGR